jgi:hypothetical protein
MPSDVTVLTPQHHQLPIGSDHFFHLPITSDHFYARFVVICPAKTDKKMDRVVRTDKKVKADMVHVGQGVPKLAFRRG